MPIYFEKLQRKLENDKNDKNYTRQTYLCSKSSDL